MQKKLKAKQSSKFINRELSWLSFNQRVLDEARDPSIPLLERLKFLAITASNLDEFFMVRVGGLQERQLRGVTKTDPAGMTPKKQLTAISDRTHAMLDEQYECFNAELEPALSEAGFYRAMAADYSPAQLETLRQIFEAEIATVLTPMAVSPTEFPLLIGRTINILVRLDAIDEKSEPRFAVIPFVRSTPRFLALQGEGDYIYTLFEDVVCLFVEQFFPGETVQEAVPFRITRNADMSVREDVAADLMEGMEEVLDARKESPCVRLEVAHSVSNESIHFLQSTLNLNEEAIFRSPGPLDLSDFMQLTDPPGFDELKYKTWKPQPSPQVDMRASMFDVISRKDVLLYHPYDSFDPVVKLVEEAAEDPDVLAIKQILYRTSRHSPIVRALSRAAQRGKHVTALLELKARFDEARNIEWARNLAQDGVQVIYGVKGLKTHAKVCVIIRREPHGIQRYTHFGTGNYNEITAGIYSDVSYMTCDEDLGADASSFFNAITGYSQPQRYRKIEMAPIGLRDKLLEMIEGETRRKSQGHKATITIKVNSLVDPSVIEALYEASSAGVKVRLNVRGICCLRPGVEGLSENIEVVSIIDRYLEHARIFYFYHGGDERVFISSADWMPRNLDKRVELLVPIEEDRCRQQLISILNIYFRDTVKARRLLPDGGYEPVKPAGRRKQLRSQEELYKQAVDAVRTTAKTQQLEFEPHRAPTPDAK